MNEYLTKAEHYRELAIKARTEAQHAPDPNVRKHLVSLSEAYDELCVTYLTLFGRTEG